MKIGALWPPQRGAQLMFDKARHGLAEFQADVYQRRHPGVPWIPQSAIEILEDMISADDLCLEWGSGSSTVWLARRTRSMVSVEHDRTWYERVRRGLRNAGLDVDTVRLLSLEPAADPDRSPYVRVVDEFADEALGVCFVDGEHRAQCALAAVPKLKSGGLMIVDDVQTFLDHASSSPYSRDGTGPRSEQWRRFAETVDGWRLVWTGDGFSDAAIWIKP